MILEGLHLRLICRRIAMETARDTPKAELVAVIAQMIQSQWAAAHVQAGHVFLDQGDVRQHIQRPLFITNSRIEQL
jgi:hypothetical protein